MRFSHHLYMWQRLIGLGFVWDVTSLYEFEIQGEMDLDENDIGCSWSPTMTCFNNRETPYTCLEIVESNPNLHAKPLTSKVHPSMIGAFPLVRKSLETSLHLIEWSTIETKDIMDSFSIKIVTEKVLLLKSSTHQNVVVASSPSRNGSLSGWRVPPSGFREVRYASGY
ncbi:hypothetical protein T459_09544 [Capsicum annuum]|uniref:Uncharacterized protein n=1 Tax=Capsicum annuum TaxID=4072 RepID=A0A2G2ZZP8_CAPAN|nr:hypothetical protein T459_09544 [Capsicum annuum]